MRIQCPECEAAFDVGTPKPGRYRPKCKHCQKAFLLKISDEQPPLAAVSRIDVEAKVTSAQTAPRPVENTKHAIVDATLEATIDSVPAAKPAASPGAKPREKTGDPRKTRSDDLEATSIQTSKVGSTRTSSVNEASAPAQRSSDLSFDQTIDSQSSGSAAARAKTPVSKPAGRSVGTIASAATQLASEASRTVDHAETSIPDRLGGYRLVRELGRGAMGAVYEAKQLSLDRMVALKTIRDRLVGSPSALARFTREAYAAARLNHHNIVQIYDFGEDDGQHYFSMERVDGQSLQDLVKQQGPLEARLAATYVLQAARGLQAAHRNGMVHRDVKPANILLSQEGVVKVADLGLVKVPDEPEVAPESSADSRISRLSGSHVTMMGTAVGTPAYMAPEQSRDSTQVDHRVDIYSLGCTFVFLLTGKPPFDAADISTMVSQHLSAPIPRVSRMHTHVAPELDQIIQRAMAKQPEDRYPSLAEMIKDLEVYLGIPADRKFSPSATQADRWAQAALQFAAASPLTRYRFAVLPSLVVLVMIVAVASLLLGWRWWLMAPSMLVTTVLIATALEPLAGAAEWNKSLRRWLVSLPLSDWIYGLVGSLVTLLIIAFTGLWAGAAAGCMLGAIGAAAYHFGFRSSIERSERPAVEQIEGLIREFRLAGADESEIHGYVSRNSGKRWAKLFQRLFGFQALDAFRETVARDPAVPPVGLTIKDRAIHWVNRRAELNREIKDQRKLSAVEQKALVSEGLSDSEAKERAWQMAAALMDATKLVAKDDHGPIAAEAKRARVKAMLADARSGRYTQPKVRLGWVSQMLGGRLRFAAGLVLLAIAAVWAQQSGALDAAQLKTLAENLKTGNVDLTQVGDTLRQQLPTALAVPHSEPNAAPELPMIGLALGGILLIGTSFVSGWLITPVAIGAAILCVMASRLGIPAIGPIPPSALAAALSIAVMLPAGWLSERLDRS